MPTFGSVTYPTSFSSMRRSGDLMRALAEFAAHSSDKSCRNTIMYCSGDFSTLRRYKEFHSARAPLKIVLKPELQKELDGLALISIAQNAKKIDAIYADIEKLLMKELDHKILPKFYASSEFAQHHCRSVTGYKTVEQVCKIAAEKLKLSKEKNLAILAKVLEEGLFGSIAKAKSLSKDLNKSGLLGPLGNRDVYKELEKHRLL